MAKVLLWNSMATRKRSPTDGFLENGLTTLKSFLEKNGHNAEIIDWQKNEFYVKLCPKPFLFLNRKSIIPEPVLSILLPPTYILSPSIVTV